GDLHRVMMKERDADERQCKQNEIDRNAGDCRWLDGRSRRSARRHRCERRGEATQTADARRSDECHLESIVEFSTVQGNHSDAAWIFACIKEKPTHFYGRASSVGAVRPMTRLDVASIQQVLDDAQIEPLSSLSQRKLNALGLPLAYVDRQQRYRLVNTAFLDCVAKPEEDVVGHTVFDVWGHDIY